MKYTDCIVLIRALLEQRRAVDHRARLDKLPDAAEHPIDEVCKGKLMAGVDKRSMKLGSSSCNPGRADNLRQRHGTGDR